jgi:hypothetical protein
MIVKYKKFLDKFLKGVFVFKKILNFCFDTKFGRFSR